MRPIVMNEYGEMLVDLPGNKARDEDPLPPSGAIGKHSCGGQMEIHRISKAFNAIHCAICGFREVIPEFVKTYFSLRWWFSEKLHKKM